MVLDAQEPPRGLFVARVAWPEVEAKLKAGAMAILPIGAASKEHGFHLPMGTDSVQAEWLCSAVAEVADVAIWPTLSYGYYPAFVEYPGSCSLSRETFIAVVSEILADIRRAGARCGAVLNTGISTIEPLQAAIANLAGEGCFQLINCYAGSHYRAAVHEVSEPTLGGHADEIETSIMLAIAPEAVQMSRASAGTTPMIQGPLNRTDPAAPNYSPSGVYGDARLANQEKGKRLVHAIVEDILERLSAAREPRRGAFD